MRGKGGEQRREQSEGAEGGSQREGAKGREQSGEATGERVGVLAEWESRGRKQNEGAECRVVMANT